MVYRDWWESLIMRKIALVLDGIDWFLFFFLCLWSRSLKLLRVSQYFVVCRHLYFFVDDKWQWILIFCHLVFCPGALSVCMRLYFLSYSRSFLGVYRHCFYYSKSVDRRRDKFFWNAGCSSRIREPHIVFLLLSIQVTTINKLILPLLLVLLLCV